VATASDQVPIDMELYLPESWVSDKARRHEAHIPESAAVGDLHTLPPADPVTCPVDEHFFIRSDGWVVGCLPDCATSADCPAGYTCSGRGSAPGGPVDEAFCQ
jgi:hypothetical protein